MSLKKMALNGLAILSLTLMASSTGWSMQQDGSGNDFEDKMGVEFTQIAMTVMRALPKMFNEIRETSGDDLSVCRAVANFGFITTREEVLKLAEKVFAESPPSPERQALIVAIYCLSNDKLRAKYGLSSTKEAREALAITITGKILYAQALSQQLFKAAQAIGKVTE